MRSARTVVIGLTVTLALAIGACGKSSPRQIEMDTFRSDLLAAQFNVQQVTWERETKTVRGKTPTDEDMEAIVVVRNCQIELERKPGTRSQEVDEARSKGGKELEIDNFPGDVTPQTVRSYLDANRNRFDCYMAGK